VLYEEDWNQDNWKTTELAGVLKPPVPPVQENPPVQELFMWNEGEVPWFEINEPKQITKPKQITMFTWNEGKIPCFRFVKRGQEEQKPYWLSEEEKTVYQEQEPFYFPDSAVEWDAGEVPWFKRWIWVFE
jgi:hypothetical protein